MKHVATSGYFNPLHKGHLELIRRAKDLGDYLTVIVNNDIQVAQKGGVFMDEQERVELVGALRYVDSVVLSIDSDSTVCQTLAMIKPDVFAKGGDSRMENVPELSVCNEIGCQVVFGLGDKCQSSSALKARILQA